MVLDLPLSLSPPSLSLRLRLPPTFDCSRTLTNVSNFCFRLSPISFFLRLTNGFFFPGTPVFPFISNLECLELEAVPSFSKVGLLLFSIHIPYPPPPPLTHQPSFTCPFNSHLHGSLK